MSNEPENLMSMREPPLSPHIQIYRPQLTSVLSILNRLTGIVLAIAAVGLVAWLWTVAGGHTMGLAACLHSWLGQAVLFLTTFCFFLHLCGGVRHLVWDSVRGLELRTIYASGWIVVIASIALTLAAWGVRVLML